MSACNALIIPADGHEPARVETNDAGLENLQTLVAGNIEAVNRDDWHFYLNEEGEILNLAPTAAPPRWFLKKPASWPMSTAGMSCSWARPTTAARPTYPKK